VIACLSLSYLGIEGFSDQVLYLGGYHPPDWLGIKHAIGLPQAVISRNGRIVGVALIIRVNSIRVLLPLLDFVFALGRQAANYR
jgi:hypothetical protein